MNTIQSITLSNGTVLRFRTRVIWCPDHAADDLAHPDCRTGTVSSFLAGRVHIRFDDDVAAKGWDFAPGIVCEVKNLWVLPEEEKPVGVWGMVKRMVCG